MRRKCLKNDIGRVTRWWFVIHDSEANIDNKWDQLKLQVAWELEPCFASQRQSDPAYSKPSAPGNLVIHQNSPENHMQSRPQADRLPLTSEKQTPSDSLESNTNNTDNSNPTKPGVDNDQSFLDSQAPTLQDTWVRTPLPTFCKSSLCFCLLYLNARSVLSKLDELLVLCDVHNYHVCIVESWLSEGVSNTELYIPGYNIFRRDRDRHGGGILIFVKSELCASPITYPLPPTNLISPINCRIL